jgi:hypothetical protein
MRLWTLHPKNLDPAGLVAVWREGLLAQKVLRGETKGYKHHPQLVRFQAMSDPLTAIAAFLGHVHGEAVHRGYQFDATKIVAVPFSGTIEETEGQLLYEWNHLKEKLKRRSPGRYEELQSLLVPQPHPLVPNHSWRCSRLGTNVGTIREAGFREGLFVAPITRSQAKICGSVAFARKCDGLTSVSMAVRGNANGSSKPGRAYPPRNVKAWRYPNCFSDMRVKSLKLERVPLG